jgi:hypothetical protein
MQRLLRLMDADDAQPWFYGMSQAFSMSRHHPYTTINPIFGVTVASIIIIF